MNTAHGVINTHTHRVNVDDDQTHKLCDYNR